jgi:membrane protease YdiL (CAAX protease family)
VVVALVGTTPWAALVGANSNYWPVVPWAVPLTALYLWPFWRYLEGAGWPTSTAQARRTNLRANRLPGKVWAAALVAGVLGIATLVLFFRLLNLMVRLPQEQVPDVSHVPVVTLFFFLLTGSAVAGIVEEASFRGYLQGPIERRHGPVVAVLVTGILFGFAHFSHPEVTLILMPYYLLVAAIYGSLAYLTNSILPSMVLHTGGNVVGGIGLLARGRSEWQASSSPAPLIWETGADMSFWVLGAVVLVVGAATIWAYAALAKVVDRHRLRVDGSGLAGLAEPHAAAAAISQDGT